MATYFVSNAGSNTAPYDTEAKAATSLATIAALWTNADIVKISSTHTESVATLSYTWPATPGLQVLSVTFNGSGTGGLAAGASVSMSTNNNVMTLVVTGFGYCYGVTFTGASGTSNSNGLNIQSTSGATGMIFESCTFSVPGTSTTARINVGAAASNTDARFVFVSCTFSQGADKAIVLRSGSATFDNMSLAGTTPTTVFLMSTLDDARFELRASDLSGVAWTNLVSVTAGVMGGYFKAIGCKLRSGFTLVTGTFAGPGSMYVEAIDCNSGDVNYYYRRESYEGVVDVSNSVYHLAGNMTDNFSIKMVSSANASFTRPLESPPLSYFNRVLAATVVTVECVNDGTTFKDNELWAETLAKITSGSPVMTWNIADRAADVLAAGANQATSTVTWTGTGGFASEIKQKLESGSFTPAEIGPITTVVKLGKASSTVYISPRIVGTSAKQWASLCGSFINEQRAGKMIGVGGGLVA